MSHEQNDAARPMSSAGYSKMHEPKHALLIETMDNCDVLEVVVVANGLTDQMQVKALQRVASRWNDEHADTQARFVTTCDRGTLYFMRVA